MTKKVAPMAEVPFAKKCLFDRVAGGGGRVAAPQSEESCAMGISGAVNGALSFEHQVICGQST